MFFRTLAVIVMVVAGVLNASAFAAPTGGGEKSAANQKSAKAAPSAAAAEKKSPAAPPAEDKAEGKSATPAKSTPAPSPAAASDATPAPAAEKSAPAATTDKTPAAPATAPAEKPAAPQPPVAPAATKISGQIIKYGQLQATVIELDQLAYVENKFSRRYKYDSFDNPKLKQLLRQEKLDELIKDAKDEFTAQKLLLKWTHQRFRKFGKPTAEVAGALDIVSAIDKGESFYCVQFADLFVSAAASVGYIARPVGLKGPESGELGSEHSVVEIWSNQYRKWIMFDPTFCMYATYKGVPLDSWQIRDRWLRAAGDGLMLVVGPDARQVTTDKLPVEVASFDGHGAIKLTKSDLGKFTMIAYIPNTNLMDAKPNWQDMFISTDSLAGDLTWHKRENPASPATEPYFPLGQAALTLSGSSDGVNVEIATNTPNFDHYEYRIDAGVWKIGRPEKWSPSAGRHTLEIVAVNKFGIRGAPTKLVLEVEPVK